MKIIVWLWNPWEKYQKTRHNIWFMFLDYLTEKENFSEFKSETKFKWEISSWNINWEKIILLKPQTYMNLSWESVRKIMDFYKIDNEDIIVIFDDLSLVFWKIRIRNTWSAWWHNWIKSIIEHLKQDFKRIKIWIWLNTNYDISDWVLSKFSNEELKELENNIFKEVYTKLKEEL